MFEIELYSKASGESPVISFMTTLRTKASTNQDARIQHKQISHYIPFLANQGFDLHWKIACHLEESIWELRPGCNRVLYFFSQYDTFVLLHIFRKRTQKTPRREIEKVKTKRADWLRRHP